jgi:FtsP/CotA-like multicopper oxidase with cupredoxin domain
VPDISRRHLLQGAAGVAGALTLGGLAACSRTGTTVLPTAAAVAAAEGARHVPGRRVVSARLTPRPVTVNLGGRVLQTWAYGDSVPGPLLRATAGDLLRVTVDNRLPAETSVHWHGIAVRNDMDGVPGITQRPINAGGSFEYAFTAPDPGTYFYHPHSGVQLDRGLYGALIVDDPAEPGRYDEEWVVVLDDWLDGTGRTPDQVLSRLRVGQNESGHSTDNRSGMNGGMGGMAGMGTEMQSAILGGAGDITYPYYLVNGKTPDAPATLSAKPGARVRIRIINAGSDTAFRLALSGHQMTVTHSDGFPVTPVTTDAVMIGMGERYDVTVSLRDGVFALVASAEGKNGQGLAVVRTGSGRTPPADVHPAQLDRRVLLGTDLAVVEQVALPAGSVDREHDVALSGSMATYRWTINGKTFPDADPLIVKQGERVRLNFLNRSMMFHPMHLHGHSFALREGGARKDTVIVRPMQTVSVDLDADNPGQWATHCHNIYHAEAGMMTTLSYEK